MAIFFKYAVKKEIEYQSVMTINLESGVREL